MKYIEKIINIILLFLLLCIFINIDFNKASAQDINITKNGSEQNCTQGFEPAKRLPSQLDIMSSYPALALSDQIEGMVFLNIEIDENGQPTNYSIQHAYPIGIFDEAAKNIYKTISYTSAKFQCKPVKSIYSTAIIFALEDFQSYQQLYNKYNPYTCNLPNYSFSKGEIFEKIAPYAIKFSALKPHIQTNIETKKLNGKKIQRYDVKVTRQDGDNLAFINLDNAMAKQIENIASEDLQKININSIYDVISASSKCAEYLSIDSKTLHSDTAFTNLMKKKYKNMDFDKLIYDLSKYIENKKFGDKIPENLKPYFDDKALAFAINKLSSRKFNEELKKIQEQETNKIN